MVSKTSGNLMRGFLPSEMGWIASRRFSASIARKLAVGAAFFSSMVAIAIGFADVIGAYVSVAVGSALGGIARHWFTGVATMLFGTAFPWGTLLINASGSFAIGFFFALTGPDGRYEATGNAKLFVMTGICGGFTTFSAFSLQSLLHFQDGAWRVGSGYVAASVILCLIAVWAGYATAVAINGMSK
jgi:CrcB protein